MNSISIEFHTWRNLMDEEFTSILNPDGIIKGGSSKVVQRRDKKMKIWWSKTRRIGRNEWFPNWVPETHFCDVGNMKVCIIMLKNHLKMSSWSFFFNFGLEMMELLAINLSSGGYIFWKEFILDTPFLSYRCTTSAYPDGY